MDSLPLVLSDGVPKPPEDATRKRYTVNMWMSLNARMQPCCMNLTSDYMRHIVMTHVTSHFGKSCHVVLDGIVEDETLGPDGVVKGVTLTYVCSVAQ